MRGLETISLAMFRAGRRAAREGEADQALKEVFAAADRGDDAVGAKGVVVSMVAPGGQRYVAHVLPLTAGARL